MRTLSIDFETASECDLKHAGAAVYAAHRSTRILVMAYRFSDEATTKYWSHGHWLFPQDVIDHVRAGGEVHAFNALFEFNIWKHVLERQVTARPDLTLAQLHCTMARAAYWGLPMKLEHAAQAIGSNYQKDMAGHRLMLRMSKPRSVDAGGMPTWWHQTDPAKYLELCNYCVRDVDTEFDLSQRLPALPAAERKIWLLDAAMNMRGLRVDVALVDKFKVLTDTALEKLDTAMATVTHGEVPSTRAVAKLIAWVKAGGVDTNSLAKGNIDNLLAMPTLPREVRSALKIRKEAAKTSTAKLNAMLDAAGHLDDRVRGLVVHYGASRTGRWAGRLVQVQNLPRPMKGVDTDHVIEHVLDDADADTIALVHGPVLDVVSSCLRACFVAAPGHTFAVCDFSAIEARVVAWLAGQQDILDVFARGEDVYVYTAKQIGSDSRQLGKVLVLACGFGMGATRFAETAAQYGITLDLMEAEKLVTTWRTKNHHIKSFWYELEAAVFDVIENNAKRMVGKLRIRMGDANGKMAGALLIQLPSARYLVYRNARIETFDGRRQISYDGVNQFSRKWETQRTYGGKLAENCIAEGTPVLTRRGWIAIEQIQDDDQLWDGEAWVTHAGLVCKGEQHVIELDGVWMTPDHEVLTTEGWQCAESVGFDRAEVRLPDGAEFRRHECREVGLERALRLRQGMGAAGHEHDTHVTRDAGVPIMFDERQERDARIVETPGECGLALDARPLPSPDASGVAQLRSARYHRLSGMGDLRAILERHGANVSDGADVGARGQQSGILESKLRVGDAHGAGEQQARQRPYRHAMGSHDSRGSLAEIGDRRDDTVVSVAQKRARVFDVLDTGRSHRFVVAGDAPLIVHNCTQAVARCLLADAMQRVEDLSYPVVGTVHDEIIAEVGHNEGPRALDDMKQIMQTPPAWADGLPLGGAGFVSRRYGKS